MFDRSPTTATAHRRRAIIGVLLLAPLSLAADAADDTAALALDDAVRMALERQPLLTGLEAEAWAAREAMVSAAQLPDPELFVGVRDIPVAGDEAFSISDDTDTQLVLGVRQSFPAGVKRRLRGLVQRRDAERLDLERARVARIVRRDAALAWVEAWRDERAVELVDAQIEEARLEADALAIAQSAARATQADVLGAVLALERWRDDAAAARQTLDAARAQLGRWIGDAADSATAEPPPRTPTPPVTELLAALPRHPEIAVLEARVETARTATELAAAGRRPDLMVQLGYGYRTEYADMAMVEVGIGLPLFTRNRQDRDIASAAAMTTAAEAARDDALRRLGAEIERAVAESRRLDARLEHYDAAVLPRATAAIDAALADWRAGRGTLAAVLAARRTALDMRLARLDIERDAETRRIEIDYFAKDLVPPGGES